MAGVLHYRIINGYVCVCVFRSVGPDEVFLSVRGNRPEQRSSNDGYHRTNRSSDAFCFSHTYFASLSLIHLSLSFFFPPPSVSVPHPNTAAHKQKQITDLMKLSWEGGLPEGAFVSHLLTAAAVAHLSHLTESTAPDDSSKRNFQTYSSVRTWKTASRHVACRNCPLGRINH